MIDYFLDEGLLWLIWLVQFFAIEFKALFNKKPGDTLSEVIRYVFGFSKRAGDLQSSGMKWRRASFYAFSAWLFGHLAFGW